MIKTKKELFEYNYDDISRLKRCTRCILPETFPFIEFDEKGVCNYCRNYVIKYKSDQISVFYKLIDKYRKRDGSEECIIPFSGGRDSSFVLHFVQREMGLNPIALTYDWGMGTDMANRNIKRICGKLGVRNVIISADIRRKRENIRKNISAWLKYPNPGMVPLFMAGDKYFFYYVHKAKKELGIKLNIWGTNPLENTDFKTGFAGISPEFDKERIYSINFINQLKLLGFVSKNLLTNPAYLNQSLPDTLGSYLARYLLPRKDYFHLFDYLKWDERKIVDTIINEYGWETANDTVSTWRIGDGTAPFYNYIYFTIAGFSEIDTFRSNQIREGMITRDEALHLSFEENLPRYEAIKWYLRTLNLDLETVINRINSIPKLYLQNFNE